MAITSSLPSKWTNSMGKRGNINEIVNANAKMFIVEVKNDNSGTYATGGLAVDLKKGLIDEIYYAFPLSSNYFVNVFYNISTSKLIIYDQNSEAAAGTTLHRNKTWNFLVIGR